MFKKSSALIYIILAVSLICLFPSSATAQISEGGLPPSFGYTNLLKSGSSAVDIPVTFSVEDLKTVDAWNVSQGAPLKVATLIPVQLSIENSGNWILLPGGEQIWQLKIQAKDAIAINLYYNDFYIPEGGKLFIYNADHTQIIGAYTHETHPKGGRFATEFVAGDDIILEYLAPDSGEKARISIEEVGYGYNHLSVVLTPRATGEGASGSCNVNINCSEGNDWQDEKNGVCQLVMKNGSSTYICSGALVNNTAVDFKPYILSAYHCLIPNDKEASVSDLNQWIFYFHYEEAGCNNASGATLIRKSMVGCTKKATTPIDGGSDGMLLLINNEIPDNYNVYYNGWDKGVTAATSGVGIHHPAGDAMKISTFTKPASGYTWNGSDTTKGMTNAHWNVVFAQTANGHGITEGGSSGSPLFNQESRIVGTLTGGNSSCTDLTGLNLYGKLSVHWNGFSTADTARMDIYLNPNNQDVNTLNGRYRSTPKAGPENVSVNYNNVASTVTINWSAPLSASGLTGYKIYRNNNVLTTTSSSVLTYTDNSLPQGNVFYSVTATYTGGFESFPVGNSVDIITHMPPSSITAVQSGYNVTISWTAPSVTSNVTGYKIYRNGNLLASKTGTNHTDINPGEGFQTYTITTTYNDGSSSKEIGKKLYVFGFKSPVDFTAQQEVKDVNLTWDAPLYEQTIQWGTTKYAWGIEANNAAPFFFGQTWGKTDIAPLNKKLIKAVSYVPTGITPVYAIYIAQGARKYYQHIGSVTSEQVNKLQTVYLTTPFVIDGNNQLYVTIKAFNYQGADYPAASDEGPAVDNRGNIFTTDSTIWTKLPADYNYNFIVRALVSSEEGVITQSLDEANLVKELATSTDLRTLKISEATPLATEYDVRAYAPLSFPVITGYNLYRNNIRLNSSVLTGNSYKDLLVGQGSHYYSVNTLYNAIESDPANQSITIVYTGVETPQASDPKVYPSPFYNQLNIDNGHTIDRIEIVSAEGKLVRNLAKPGTVINTESLVPGYYIIRLYQNNKITVVKAIKR